MKKDYIRLESDDLTENLKLEKLKFFERLKNSIFLTYY